MAVRRGVAAAVLSVDKQNVCDVGEGQSGVRINDLSSTRKRDNRPSITVSS